ncbi:MAG: hypothetical protein ACJ8J0_23210 [Longimicrobiaceae bacterium]
MYRERFAEHVRGEYARLEALVSKHDQELTDAADTITAAADREAAEQSRRVVDAPNGPLSVKFIDSQGQPCALKNVAGADLVNEPTR